MLKTKDILDEKDKRLRLVSKEVEFPLTKKDKDLINTMIEYLHNSQIEELAENGQFKILAHPALLHLLGSVFGVVDAFHLGDGNLWKKYMLMKVKDV